MDSSPKGIGDEFGASMSFLGTSPFTKRFDQKSTSDSSTRDSSIGKTSPANVNPGPQSSTVFHCEEQDSERNSIQTKDDAELSKESGVEDVLPSRQQNPMDSSSVSPCESPRPQLDGPSSFKVCLFSFLSFRIWMNILLSQRISGIVYCVARIM